ncbi:MAG TPA: PAS domain S-box protein, partial [Thermosynechococcaceae cyanobacterium]
MTQSSTADQLFAGQGEMAMRMRSLDWSQTPLGAIETWSDSVQMTVQVLLTELDQAKQPEQAPLELESDLPQECRAAEAFRVRLTKALRPLTDADEIQAIAARILGESLGASRVIYIEVLPGDKEVIAHKNYTNGVTELSGLYHVEDFGRNLTDDHQAGQAVIVPDVANYPKYAASQKASYQAIDIAAHIDVPLIKNERFVALLAVHQATPRQWTEDEVKRVEETAEQTWATVERARAEAALRQSEEQCRNILESIAEAFFALDENWRFTYVNRSVEVLLDRTPGDLIGKSIWEEYPGLIGSEFERSYRGAMLDRVAASLTAFYPDHDRWYEVRTYPAPNGITVYFRNVTEQIQTAVSLRQSEERYRTLFESIDEGFCLIEVLFDENDTPIDYRFLEINPAFEEQTGLQQAVGKTARQLVPDLEDHWIQIYGQVALTGELTRFENGSEAMNRWFDVYACRTGDPEERKVAVVFKDISERKATEEILRRDTNLSAFRVSLTDALRLLADPIAVQATASRLLGEYLGANRVAYFEVRDADYVVERDYVNGVTALVGKYPIDSFGQELLATYRTGRPVCVSDVAADLNLTTDQQSAYAAIQIGAYIGIPLIKHGEFVAGMAVHTVSPRAWTPDEVTLVQEVAERIWSAIERAQIEADLRRSEAEFRIISNAAPALVWVGAQDGSVNFFNDRWYKFTGQTEAEAIGFGWANATHPDDLARILPYWEHCRQTGEPYDGEVRYRRHDGEYYWYAFRALPRRNEAGEVEAWYGLSIDISERKQAAAEREQLLQQE